MQANAQTSSCHAYFTYVYKPYLSEPEQDIYLFTDSSTGEDSTTKFEWSFGTGDFSDVQSPGFNYDPDDSGFEQVCLTIYNHDSSCYSTWCDTIRVDDLCTGASYTYNMQGNTVIFKASICGAYDSITWNFGDGSTASGTDSIAHTYPAAVDSYQVCMQVFINSVCSFLYPCKSYQCEEIQIYPTGITNVAPAGHIKVYPDPAEMNISITTNNVDFPARMYITDATGRRLSDISVYNTMQMINIANLAAGIYFVQIESNSGQEEVTRFVKK